MDERRDKMPKWVENGIGGGLAFFLLIYIGTLLMPDDVRHRFADAGTAVGAFALLAAVSAAVIALRQLDLQRRSLQEQARTFQLERYSDLRREYARLIGAAHDCQVAITLGSSEEFPFARFAKVLQQVQLHDRSEVRSRIAGAIRVLLHEQHDNFQKAWTIMYTVRDLIEMLTNLEPPPTGDLESALGIFTDALVRMPRERFHEHAKTMSDRDISFFRRDAIGLAQRVLRASLSADERLTEPLRLADVANEVSAAGTVTKATQRALRRSPENEDED